MRRTGAKAGFMQAEGGFCFALLRTRSTKEDFRFTGVPSPSSGGVSAGEVPGENDHDGADR